MPVISIRSFAPLMRQRVTVERLSSYDSDGEASYGSGVAYQAAVVGETKMVTNTHGQEVPSRQAIYLMSGDPVRPVDRVTLSTGDVASTEEWALRPEILAVDRYPFVGGQFLTVIRLGDRGGQ